MAPPPIVLRPLDHPGPHGIEGDIADERHQVALLLDQEPLETPLEEMPRAFVSPVEPLGVLAVHPLHAARERGLRRLNHEMEMVGHEGIGMDDPTEAPDGLGEDAEEHQVIFVAEADAAAIVAAGGGVPYGP